MRQPLVDLLLYFALALLVLVMIPTGIVLMLLFTIVDGAARALGRLRRARR